MSARRDHGDVIKRMAAARCPPAAAPKPKDEPEPPHPREHELLPCPRCAGRAELAFASGDWGYTPPTVRAGCEPCGLWTPARDREGWSSARGHFDIEAQAINSVITWWNTRA